MSVDRQIYTVAGSVKKYEKFYKKNNKNILFQLKGA